MIPQNRQHHLPVFEKRMKEGIHSFPYRNFLFIYNRTKCYTPGNPGAGIDRTNEAGPPSEHIYFLLVQLYANRDKEDSWNPGCPTPRDRVESRNLGCLTSRDRVESRNLGCPTSRDRVESRNLGCLTSRDRVESRNLGCLTWRDRVESRNLGCLTSRNKVESRNPGCRYIPRFPFFFML